MADRNAIGPYVFFPEQRDLFHRELAEVCGVRHHACAGPALRTRRRAKYAFLGRRNVLALSPDLTDDAGPDIGTVGATHNVGDDQICKIVGIALMNKRRIYALAVPAGTHDDPDT